MNNNNNNKFFMNNNNNNKFFMNKNNETYYNLTNKNRPSLTYNKRNNYQLISITIIEIIIIINNKYNKEVKICHSTCNNQQSCI